MVLGYLFMVSQPDLSSLELSWLCDSQLCVGSQVCSLGRDKVTEGNQKTYIHASGITVFLRLWIKKEFIRELAPRQKARRN